MKCYLPLDEPNVRIIHLIITRFLIEFNDKINFKKILYKKDYTTNGIRLMKEYLFPSLESQSCSDFIWILILGDKANITYIKSLINLNSLFEVKIMFYKDLNKQVKNITKGFDILITTRIDYNDIIYYDAVNNVRKAINMNKPMILYGFNRGFYYYESNGKCYEFYLKSKDGAHSIFTSLIIVLHKVNNTYTIYNMGNHMHIRKNLLKDYMKFGLKDLNYEPAIFDSGGPKFVYVRQKYSHSLKHYKNLKIKNREINLNFNKFFGK